MTFPAEVALGPLVFHGYGLCIGLGALAGMEVVSRAGRKRGMDTDQLWMGMVWAGIGAVVGARLYHVVDWWSYYSHHPELIPALWLGGLGIYGALAGGVVGLWLYNLVRRRTKNDHGFLIKMLDTYALGIPLAQAIGRWGNFFNQELYGLPTQLPWGIYIAPEHRLPGFELETTYQPLFLYESLLLLGLWLGLGWIERKSWWKWGSGNYMAGYLVGYAAIRFGLEGLRINPWMFNGVPMARWVSLSVFLVGGLWFNRTQIMKRKE